MKKYFTFVSALILTVLLLAACDGTSSTSSVTASLKASTNSETSTPVIQNTSRAQTETATDSLQDGRGDILEEQVPDGADIIRQGVYYYDLAEFSDDYGDGLSPREGAELTDKLLASIGFYTDDGGIPAELCVYISFDELAVLDSAEGRECYLYTVGLGTAEGGLMGNGYEAIYRVFVDYGGSKTAAIHEDFSSGRGDLIGDSDIQLQEAPNWNGEYIDRDAGYSMTISDFNEVSFFDFQVSLLRSGSNILEGKATISYDSDYSAHYGYDDKHVILFNLFFDSSTIEVFAPEGSEWAHLSGSYERIE